MILKHSAYIYSTTFSSSTTLNPKTTGIPLKNSLPALCIWEGWGERESKLQPGTMLREGWATRDQVDAVS